MRNMKTLLSLSLFTLVLMFCSFTPIKEVKQPATKSAAKIVNYAWYAPDGTFVAWSTLANALVVSDADLDPTNGTVVAYGWTGGGFGLPPSGTLVYTIYSHP